MSLTSDFFASPLEFAKENSICPPDDIGGYKGKQAAVLDTSGYKGIGPGTEVTSVKYSRVMRSKKIGYIELFNDMRAVGNNEGLGVVRLKTQYSTFGEAGPVYFLPWDAGGAIVKLRIPNKGAHAPDPDIFFTAAINGCSVFVQGNPDAPTVYHAGGGTGRSDANDAARFWRQTLANHIKDSQSAQGRGKIGGEVNKTDYVKTPGTVNNQSTPRAEAYERQLKEKLNKKKSFQVTTVFPWGCVFGVRTGVNWAFYLQENATVKCDYVSWFKPVRTVSYARPVQLTKIFPGGTSRIASMSHLVPVKIS
ncbi:MAG TPA: hypothetical protein VMF08_18910 [Candidatus Sulfotelmatobacter sp.]|nr:hypothetical protein [Candidatus Sulfotelmatobacter sp.]